MTAARTTRLYAPVCYWPPDIGDLGLHGVRTFYYAGQPVDAAAVARHYGVAVLTRLLELDTFGRMTRRAERFYAAFRLQPHDQEFHAHLERSIERSLQGTPAMLGGPQGALESVCSATAPGLAREVYKVLTTFRDPGHDLSGGYRLQTIWQHAVYGLCYLGGAVLEPRVPSCACDRA